MRDEENTRSPQPGDDTRCFTAPSSQHLEAMAAMEAAHIPPEELLWDRLEFERRQQQ